MQTGFYWQKEPIFCQQYWQKNVIFTEKNSFLPQEDDKAGKGSPVLNAKQLLLAKRTYFLPVVLAEKRYFCQNKLIYASKDKTMDKIHLI